MGHFVYLDPCNKWIVNRYTKLVSVPSKQSAKLEKATIHNFAVN